MLRMVHLELNQAIQVKKNDSGVEEQDLNCNTRHVALKDETFELKSL